MFNQYFFPGFEGTHGCSIYKSVISKLSILVVDSQEQKLHRQMGVMKPSSARQRMQEVATRPSHQSSFAKSLGHRGGKHHPENHPKRLSETLTAHAHQHEKLYVCIYIYIFTHDRQVHVLCTQQCVYDNFYIYLYRHYIVYIVYI